MRKVPPAILRKRNLRALVLAALATAAILVLFSLPAVEFTTTLYTKKSGNTFVGDERYRAALEEVNAAAETYRNRPDVGDVTVNEEVTRRVNSKGETTSLVVFRVNAVSVRNAWAFMASGLPSGRVLLAAALALLLALLLISSSLPATLAKNAAGPPERGAVLRRAACWLTLGALLLVPVFYFHTVNVFERQIVFQASQGTTPRLTALLQVADAFLFGGQGGEETGAMVSGMIYHSVWTFWLLIPAVFLLLVQMIRLSGAPLGRTLARGFLYLFVIAMCAMILYPYYVMLVTAFRENAEATDMYFTHVFPTKWVWSNIVDILNRGVLRFLLNSFALSGGATLIALGCGIPAAYAMARMSFRGKKAFLGFVIMSQMFAPIVLLVGISQLMNFLKLNDNIAGLMLINAAFNQAFAIWLLRGTFVSISPEMEQAASIDGCSTVGALLRVLLPMAAPGIVTTLIFVFINSWNEYTISTVLISTPYKKPITVGITQFSSFNMIEWQYLFASALLATIPVVILFMFIEKHLVAGLTSGGVKG